MKKHHLISFLFATVTVSVWLFLFIIPALDKMKTLDQQVTESAEQLNDFKRTMLDAPAYFEAHKKLLEQKKKLSSQLYTKEDLIRLFNDLTNVADKNNLSITEITPSIEELLVLNRLIPREDEPQILHLEINFEGGFRNIGEFIKEVENKRFNQGLEHCVIVNTANVSNKSKVKYGFKAVLGSAGVIL
jgi:Tfp pilus assembly protein PilO